jgi:hypothetical protein
MNDIETDRSGTHKLVTHLWWRIIERSKAMLVHTIGVSAANATKCI